MNPGTLGYILVIEAPSWVSESGKHCKDGSFLKDLLITRLHPKREDLEEEDQGEDERNVIL